MSDAMLHTRCPECRTTFRVTAAILQKADGQVRCGRCAHIFDANAYLRDVPQTADPTAPPRASTPHADAAAGPGGSGAESERKTEQVEDDATAALEREAGASTESETDPESVRQAAVETDEAAEAGTSEGADKAAAAWTREPGSLQNLGGLDLDRLLQATPEDDGAKERAAADSGAGAATADTTAADSEAGSAVFSGGAAGKADADGANAAGQAGGDSDNDGDNDGDTDSDSDVDVDSDGIGDTSRSDRESGLPGLWRLADARTPRREWRIGAGVLLAILLLQLAHHYRAALARVPVMGSAVSALYSTFGSDLTRHYDLAQYDIVDSAAVAQPDAGERGWLLIETRLRNNGPRIQPYPHIFLTLEDRWQKNIAGRYFAPDEYLVTPVSDVAQMEVGRVVDAQFIIVDPGPQASGFEVDVCVPVGDGFSCAADAQID